MRIALPPGFAHQFRDGVRADQVVQDRLAGMLSQQRFGDQRRDHVAAELPAVAVDQEHPVGVAVEGHPEVGSVSAAIFFCRSLEVFQLDG